ncbi:MAG TPA: TIGR04551 family protein, partial [Anaeromyxobacteraceae bacterium]|nr:TIGR04551 family protein [Anaeromyxobacteraceae bacterium]
MSRLLAALVAALLLTAGGVPEAAAAQDKEGTAPPAPAGETPAAKPGALAPLAPPATEVDPAVRNLVRQEVDKAKEEMKDEVRAEIAARTPSEGEEGGAVERRKLDFLQLNGYLRLRSDLFDNLDLHRDADPNGYFLFPRPLRDAENRGTLTSDNMRFRLEPTLNVSEQVRVLSQIDMLDDIVLGSTPQGFFFQSTGVQFPFDSTGQVPPTAGQNSDRNSIVVKRAWAEVQTPLGLLSFGRMPSQFGLGMLSNAGSGIDDDLGDSVDRLQFALSPIRTPLGELVFIPMYEIVATGVTSEPNSGGVGQPFDRDPADDTKAIGIKVVHVDTDEEMKRKFERNEASVSYGAWYMYKSEGYEFPSYMSANTLPSANSSNPNNDQVGTALKSDAYAHTLDLWYRYQTRRFRFESELAGIIGQIGNAGNGLSVLLRQWGGVAQAEWKLGEGKLHLGGEFGIASGGDDPGFGENPGRPCTSSPCRPGTIDGPQFAPTDRVPAIRNFRFNQAYRVDLILFKEIIGGVTDAFYLKPSVNYEFIDGLSGWLALVYSQAMTAVSTPSSTSTPLGVEADLGVKYQTEDGFIAWLNFGIFQPFGAFDYLPN